MPFADGWLMLSSFFAYFFFGCRFSSLIARAFAIIARYAAVAFDASFRRQLADCRCLRPLMPRIRFLPPLDISHFCLFR